TGAGSAGLAASATKAGAVVVAAGAIVAGAPQLADREHHRTARHPAAPAAEAARPARPAPKPIAASAAASAQEVPVALEDKGSSGPTGSGTSADDPGSVSSGPGDLSRSDGGR